jgi:DNA-binding PadR family transcriptional regulator
MGPATLYTIVRRFLDSGFIAESAHRPDPALDDERRRYYRLTEAGRAVARAEAARMEAVLTAARAKNLLRRPRRT